MSLVKRTLYLAVAIATVGLLATSAQADVLLCNDASLPDPCVGSTDGNYFLAAPLGGPDAENAFVESVTGTTGELDPFSKHENGGDQFFTTDPGTLTVDQSDGDLWKISWSTVNWDIRFILVKDGSDGAGNQVYTLFGVTTDQFRDSNGEQEVFINGDFGGISHITVFGTEGVGVPEPATLLLLGAGLLGTVALGRRRK